MQGHLQLNHDSKRWEIVNDDRTIELSCGACIELHIGGHWIPTRIEYGDKSYYSTTKGTRLVQDLTARIEL